jgi:signal peptidase II
VKSNPVIIENAAPGRDSSLDSAGISELSKQDLRLPFSRYVLFFCVATAGVLADLVTKYVAFQYYFEPTEIVQLPHWWIDGVFGLQTATNPGALFGMGSGFSWLFAILSVAAISVIVGWLFWFNGAADRWLTFTLALITGGILGNLYDRVGLGAMPSYPAEIHTNVRDWILFHLDGVPFFQPWPNFNLADCWLVSGAALLFFHALFLSPENEAPVGAESDQKNS